MSRKLTKQERVSLEREEGESQEEFLFDKDKKNQDIIIVKITLETYQNIISFFPTSDIKTQCSFEGKSIGETTWMPVIDSDYLPIDKTFSFTIDKSSARDIDKLISAPIVITITQARGTFDPRSYDILQLNQEFGSIDSLRSLESIIDIYEAFTDQTVIRSEIFDQPTKKTRKLKKIKGNKNSKKQRERSSLGSQSSGRGEGSLLIESVRNLHEPTSEYQEEPIVYGMCTIDLLPFFNRETSISETLLIRPVEKYYDERMLSHKAHPKLSVTVSIDKDISFAGSTMMNITVESIYNIPPSMKSEGDYKLNVMLAKGITRKIPILFTNPIYTTQPGGHSNKCWPGLRKIGINANTTKYLLSNDDDELLNKVGEDIRPYLIEENPKLVFNMIKRNILLEDGSEELAEQIRTHRKIMLEFSTKVNRKYNYPFPRPEKDLSVPSIKFGSEFLKKSKQLSPHFLVALDVSELLYPGVSRIRLASPLTSYSIEEALKYGSQDDTLLTTATKKNIPSKEALNKTKDKTNKIKDSEKSEKSSVKSKDKEPVDKDLKKLLPVKPEPEPEPEPVVPILNDQGKPCFIIVEIELSKSITPEREMEDLTDGMHELLQRKPQLPSKIILCNCLTKSYYGELVKATMRDIDKKFERFLTEHPDFKARSYKTQDFMKFLQSIGAYQLYSNSIMKAAILFVRSEFNLGESEINRKGCQGFIEQVYYRLLSEMNNNLNKLFCTKIEPSCEDNFLPKLHFYAKEALEVRDTKLAEKYFLERICRDKQNSENWFDYGVFFLVMRDVDMAFECMREALLKNPSHGNSLMAMGVLLDNKGQKEEAETCFLDMMVLFPKWLEGWGVLYIFYSKYSCYEGMDVALEMANKCIDRDAEDSFKLVDDLAWTPEIFPKTIFLQTAITLVKMRLYDWAEIALSEELTKHCGLVHYLLAVICYYKGLYLHGLEHIREAKNHYGANHAVASLSGHCLLALGREKEAKSEYYYAMAEFERPKNIHLIYLNLAKILERDGQDQDARKLLLLACKYDPTPYTWLKAGLLYLVENDLLSAEECFSEGNIRDPRHAELWGNLCLVNLKLNRRQEAELCYEQAMYNNLASGALLEAIQEEMQN